MKPSIQITLLLASTCLAFQTPGRMNGSSNSNKYRSSLAAAPRRLGDNVDGVLYVNEKCINCAACAMFAGDNFRRSDVGNHHVVVKQPASESEIAQSRAALAACPVAAIRVETKAHRQHRGMESLTPEEESLAKNMAISPKVNGLEKPFPLEVSKNVWYVGHHSSETFGAVPYLTNSPWGWVLMDSPKYSKSAVDAITKLTGPEGPSYMVLSHVDDTADHGRWKEEFEGMKRVFHSGDLGKHNWKGDLTLEDVEILLEEKSTSDQLQAFAVDGTPLSPEEAAASSLVLYHTPGHSPGSISLLQRDGSTLFTGDTLGYTTRTDSLTGFPMYGNDRRQQSRTLELMETQIEGWEIVAPGHGHVRNFGALGVDKRIEEMEDAREELRAFIRGRR